MKIFQLRSIHPLLETVTVKVWDDFRELNTVTQETPVLENNGKKWGKKKVSTFYVSLRISSLCKLIKKSKYLREKENAASIPSPARPWLWPLSVTVTPVFAPVSSTLLRENEDITFYVIELLEKIELLLSHANFKFKWCLIITVHLFEGKMLSC